MSIHTIGWFVCLFERRGKRQVTSLLCPHPRSSLETIQSSYSSIGLQGPRQTLSRGDMRTLRLSARHLSSLTASLTVMIFSPKTEIFVLLLMTQSLFLMSLHTDLVNTPVTRFPLWHCLAPTSSLGTSASPWVPSLLGWYLWPCTAHALLG